MLAFGTDHGGFADATHDDLAKIEPSLGQARNLTIDATDKTFTVSVDSAAANGAKFSIEHTADGRRDPRLHAAGHRRLPRRPPTPTAIAGSRSGQHPIRSTRGRNGR